MSAPPDRPYSPPGLRGRWIRLTLGIAVSAVSLGLLARHVDARAIGARLMGVDLEWALLLLAIKVAVLIAKERRWRGILAAMTERPLAATWRATAAGYFGNLVLPFRLGDLVRASILSRANRPFALIDVGATLATERLLDMSVLAALVLPLLPRIGAPAWMRQGTGVLATLIACAALLAFFAPRYERWATQLSSAKIRRLLLSAAGAARRGTAVLRHRRHLGTTVAWTIGIWLTDALSLLCGARALAATLAYPSAVLVTLLYAFGSLVPSAPVQIGTHQALTVLFLRPLGIPAATAVSISIVLQSANLMVLGALGGPALVWSVIATGPDNGRDARASQP